MSKKTINVPVELTLCYSCEEDGNFLYIMDDAVEEGQEAAAAAGTQPVPPCVVILPEVC
jgi:hypothetical protein